MRLLNERSIFLLDGLGAVTSAYVTGQVLPRFSIFLGLNWSLLKTLALVPTVYAVFSLSVFLFFKKPKPWMLMTIMCANIIYCLIDLGLIVFRERITWRAQAFLGAEIAIILLIVFLEYRVYRKIKTV